MGQAGKLLKIQHCQGRIGNALRKYRFGIWPECLCQFLLVRIRIHQRALHSHLGKGNGKQIGGTAVYGGGADYMVSRLADIQYSIKGSCLSRRSEHGPHAALQLADL